MTTDKDLMQWYLKAFMVTTAFLALMFWAGTAKAESINVNALADAIYKAEGSVKYPYGIKSINTHGDKAYARKICLNTIRNHIKRHNKHHCGRDYITCLGMRYCPPSIHSLNRHWEHNVKHHYNRLTAERGRR